jgi:virulence factor
MDNVRVGIIGCGKRGRGHLRILNDFDDVSLVAACDPVVASRQTIADEFGIKQQYDAIEAMLDSAGLDAVLVTPPAHLNGKLALPCLERGVHALIEKPPGLSVKETQGLKDAADRTGAKVVVGWNRRFHPVITQARKTILDHGPMTQLVGEFHKNINQQAASGAFPESFLDQLLLETPIHAIDTIRFLADSDVKELHSIVRRSMSQYRDVHATLMEFENGVVAQTIHNYTTGARLERYEIHGHNISAYMEGVSGGQVFFEGETTEIVKGPTGGTEEQDRYFIDCVKSDQPVGLPAADLGEAVKTMEFMEAIMSGTK